MNGTVWTKVNVSRALTIETTLFTSEGRKTVKFSQSLKYSNQARYEDEGWVQVNPVNLNHRDAKKYPSGPNKQPQAQQTRSTENLLSFEMHFRIH
jgi:hypothetical protein